MKKQDAIAKLKPVTKSLVLVSIMYCKSLVLCKIGKFSFKEISHFSLKVNSKPTITTTNTWTKIRS